MIVLGESVNDALVTISENITTPLAVAAPYDSRLHFTQDIFHLSPLIRTITDPHFGARDRMGRLSAFMARQVKDGFAAPDILGIGVDDGAALVIDSHGLGVRLADAHGPAVYVVRGGLPEQATAGLPLIYRGLHVVKLGAPEHTFDFTKRCGKGTFTDFDVDGTLSAPYAPLVYADGSFADECL
jgi:cyanophycinase-like exopeptidase